MCLTLNLFNPTWWVQISFTSISSFVTVSYIFYDISSPFSSQQSPRLSYLSTDVKSQFASYSHSLLSLSIVFYTTNILPPIQGRLFHLVIPSTRLYFFMIPHCRVISSTSRHFVLLPVFCHCWFGMTREGWYDTALEQYNSW